MNNFSKLIISVICVCFCSSSFASDYNKEDAESLSRKYYCESLNGIDITDMAVIKSSRSVKPYAVCLSPYLEKEGTASIQSSGCVVRTFATGCASIRPPTGTAIIGSAVTSCSADMYAKGNLGTTTYGTAMVRCRVYGSPTGASSGGVDVSVPASIVIGQEPYGGTVSVTFEYIAGRLGSVGTAMDFSYQGDVAGISYQDVTDVINVSN